MGLLGMGIERWTLRPVRQYPMTVTMLVTLGLSLILQNVTLIITGGVPKNIISPFSEVPISIGGVRMAPVRVFAAAAAACVILGTHFFLTRTKHGNAMRASFQDKEASLLVGINVSRIYMLTFALGAGLAALGGGLTGTLSYVDPAMGAKGLMKCFVVVTIGGMGSFIGAIFGGLALGLIEALAAAYISSEYADLIGFVMVIGILLFAPTGLFGAKERTA